MHAYEPIHIEIKSVSIRNAFDHNKLSDNRDIDIVEWNHAEFIYNWRYQ